MRSSRFPPQPALVQTARLTLVPLRPEHATALFTSLGDPGIYAFIPLEPPTSVAELEARYRRMRAGPQTDGQRWWNWAVAACKRPDWFFGTVQLTITTAERRAILGYVFARSQWGQGFAFEACRGALNALYEHLRDAVVDAFIDTRNTRSIALAGRLGF